MIKNYIPDTNIYLSDENCITKLINGNENKVYLSKRVLLELDKLKTDPRKSHLVSKAIKKIKENLDKLIFIDDNLNVDHPDLKILNEIKQSNIENPILVTNDNIFQILSNLNNIESQPYLESNSFKSESEIFNGFLTEDNKDENIKNYFTWEKGHPVFHNNFNKKHITYINSALNNIIPRKINDKEHDIYQNLAMELLLDDSLPLISLEGKAGVGKSLLALACGFHKVLNEKRYEKVIVVKPIVEIGNSLAALPGTYLEKIEPYYEYIYYLIQTIEKLNNKKLNIFKPNSTILDNTKIQFLPLNFIRGMNIDNSYIIIDESQNISRHEIRSILTRMGQTVKCVVLGDISQIDVHYLNEYTNALSWIIRIMKESEYYAHLKINSKLTRGHICSEVTRLGL